MASHHSFHHIVTSCTTGVIAGLKEKQKKRHSDNWFQTIESGRLGLSAQACTLAKVPCEISCPSVFHRSFHCLCCTLDNCWILVPWSKSVSAFYRLKECTKALSLKCISVNSGIEFDLWGSWGRLAGGTSRVGPLSLSQPQVMANYIFISPRSKAVRKTCFQNHLPSWEHAAISRQKSVICFVWWGKTKKSVTRSGDNS